ncbi:hypothetical protein SD81_040375 [Tolypothrix campylonemoides VB511288]|nr:hypothetical protein SD81_040375 [Tolypothrix campylonemoides VB511288]
MHAGRTSTKPRPVRGFVVSALAFGVFKWTVYALLALNVALYGLHGTLNEQLDTAAWVVLLLLFEWETGAWRMSSLQRRAAHAVRAAAALAIAWACIGYAREREWLDFANAATWVAVVVALELEVRVPPARRRFHRARRALTVGLYVALASFLVAWLLLGLAEGGAAAWLDAWDAALWLLAFAVIELNVFGWARAVGSSTRA